MNDERKKFSRGGNLQRKYYLSPEAIAKLEAESAATSYPMGVIVDMLIKKYLPLTFRKPRDPEIVAARKERFDL